MDFPRTTPPFEVEGPPAEPIRYRDWEIFPNEPLPPTPNAEKLAWAFTHKDFDGPDDSRCGYAATIEACIEEIDEREYRRPLRP